MKWRRWRLPENLGSLLLSIWLIGTGATPLLEIGGRGLATILQLLAVAAGVFLLLGRR